jgi:hypothetical protein
MKNHHRLPYPGMLRLTMYMILINQSIIPDRDFIYSYNRHNEVNLNLGFVKGSYTTENVRANLALMTGTYANANLAAEPGVLKNMSSKLTQVLPRSLKIKTYGLMLVYLAPISVSKVRSEKIAGI